MTTRDEALQALVAEWRDADPESEEWRNRELPHYQIQGLNQAADSLDAILVRPPQPDALRTSIEKLATHVANMDFPAILPAARNELSKMIGAALAAQEKSE